MNASSNGQFFGFTTFNQALIKSFDNIPYDAWQQQHPYKEWHKGKRMINGGRAHVRAILYMGAVVAMRHKECYQNFL